MFWHLDVDIISLLVIFSLFFYFIFTQSEEKPSRSDKFFLLMLIAGGIATGLDLVVSSMLTTNASIFLYYFFMTLYFVYFQALFLLWFFYNSSLIFSSQPRISRRFNRIFTIPFVVYFGFFIANLWGGWFFKISGGENPYSRGSFFFLSLLPFFVYPFVILLLAIINRKTISDKYPLPLFIITPSILIFGVIFQLAMKGWLLILPIYMFSILVTFLFVQAKQYRINEMTREQVRNYTTHVPCGLIIGFINTKHQFSFQNINQAYFDLLEEPKEFMLSRYKNDLFAGIHIQDRPIVEEKIKDLCAYHRDQEFVYRFISGKNKIKWIHAQIRAIHNDDNTAIAYITVSEITSLMDKITQFQMVIENIPCGISIFKCRGKNIHHLYHNQKLLEILGIPCIDQYTNFDTFDFSLVHKDDIEKLRTMSIDAFKEKNPFSILFQFYNPKKEKYLTIKTEAHKLLDSAGNDIVFLIYSDETDRLEKEACGTAFSFTEEAKIGK